MLANVTKVACFIYIRGYLLMVNEKINEENEKNNEESPVMHDEGLSQGEDIDLTQLYEQSFQEVPTGKIVTGTVVEISDDLVMVDVGYKTEGRLPIDECKDGNGDVTVSVGDEIEVLVDSKKEDDLILSRDKALRSKVWKDIIAAHEDGSTVQGTVINKVKGGLSVDIGVVAFLPGSQIEIHPVRDFDRYVGKSYDFNILKYDRKRNNVVLSHKTILEKEREEKKKGLLDQLEEGMVVEGTVKNITDYGLFIDLGGIDGLLHITDMSWGRIRHPADNYSKGDKITVKVLSFDKEKERVSLGLKQLIKNPWDTISERYIVNSIVEGKVVSYTDYGAFVELEPGVEGLVHVSEMFWTKKIRHPSTVVGVGETIHVAVLEVDAENRRISLGLKQTMENPWDAMKAKYPEGSIIEGKIRNITDFGMFVGIESDIDGLIHVSDISWTKRIKHPGELYKKGQEVKAVVLKVDAENEKFSLGVKQLEKNPWEELRSKYGAGAVISGTVTNVTDFGIFVEIEEGMEGLVHISEVGKKDKPLTEIYPVGSTVSAVIKNIDPDNQKVGLSIKGYEQASEASTIKQYVNNSEKVVSNLGEILSGMKM